MYSLSLSYSFLLERSGHIVRNQICISPDGYELDIALVFSVDDIFNLRIDSDGWDDDLYKRKEIKRIRQTKDAEVHIPLNEILDLISYENIINKIGNFYIVNIAPLNDEILKLAETRIGLMASDNTGWQDDFIKENFNQPYSINWNSKRPSGTNDTIKELRETIKRNGFFDLLYIKNSEVKYVAQIIEIASTDRELKILQSKYSGLNLKDSLENYTDRNFHARILFVCQSFKEVYPPIPRTEFKTFGEFEYPRQDNLSPFYMDSSLIKTDVKVQISPSEKINNTMNCLNQILYGPPGTGKTYNSIDKAVEIASPPGYTFNNHDANKLVFDELRKLRQIEFVTFHQNYSYEDFIVGISPDVTSDSLRFKKREGVFKNLTEEARNNWLASKRSEQSDIDFDYVFNSYFKSLIEEEVSEIEIPMKSKNYSFNITSIDVEDKRIKFRKKSGGTNHDLLIKNVKRIYEGTLDYGTESLGVYYNPLVEQLKEYAKKLTPPQIITEQLRNFVMVIDEINRANISKVFGELITLLEDDKRLGAENELRVTLPNGEEDFGVPPNLYIIGTMNTADKSIALIDIALRRRFEFIGYYPKYDGYDQEASNLLKIINANIFDRKKSADYLIGHAYFMKGQPIETVLVNKVLPLLMEYFSGKTEIVKEIFSGSNWSANYDSTTYSWVIKQE